MSAGLLAPSTAALILFGVFFALLVLRVPVAFALGLACVPLMIFEERLSMQNLVQETFNAYNSFILLFAFVFLWAGWEFTRFAWNRVSELADLPLWMFHVAWPVTGLTWFVFQSERMGDAAMVLAGRAQPKAEAKHLEAAE